MKKYERMDNTTQGRFTRELVKAKTEALQQASYKIAEEVYKQQQAAGAGAQPGADAGADAGAAGADSTKSSGFDKGNADDVDFEVKDE